MSHSVPVVHVAGKWQFCYTDVTGNVYVNM